MCFYTYLYAYIHVTLSTLFLFLSQITRNCCKPANRLAETFTCLLTLHRVKNLSHCASRLYLSHNSTTHTATRLQSDPHENNPTGIPPTALALASFADWFRVNIPQHPHGPFRTSSIGKQILFSPEVGTSEALFCLRRLKCGEEDSLYFLAPLHM